MKKILGLVPVLFFVFSLLPVPVASAGPAYEKLEGRYLTIFYQDNKTKVCYSEKEFQEYLNTFSKKILRKIRLNTKKYFPTKDKRKKDFIYVKLIEAKEIFSDESFRETIKSCSARFMKKISNLLDLVKWSEEQRERIFISMFDDLKSKGFCEAEMNHLFAMFILVNNPSINGKSRENLYKFKW